MEKARHPLTLAGVFIVYILIAEAGLALVGQPSIAPPFRPASGFALAALIVLGLRTWPAILAASVTVAFGVTSHFGSSLLTGASLTLGAMMAARLVDRHAGGRAVFSSVKQTFRGLAFVLVAAIVPAVTVALVGESPGQAADSGLSGGVIVLQAWLGQVTGILVIAPAMLLAMTTTRREFSRERWPAIAESLALFVTFALTALMVFAGLTPYDVKTYPLEFLCLPFLLWAAFRFGPREVTLAVAMLSAIAVWGTLRGLGPFADEAPHEASGLLQAYLAVMSITGIAFATAVAERRHAEAQLQELAITDPLTGLVNYRRLLEVMKQEMARSRRTGRSFAVLLVDMDGLKRINDRFGHLAGSRALCRVADVLRRSTRETDVVSRFGGDEFAIVLPESGDDGGQAVLARVSNRLALEPGSPALSVSGGHAVFPRDGDSATLLLRIADQKLYESKRASRAPAPQTALAETG